MWGLGFRIKDHARNVCRAGVLGVGVSQDRTNDEELHKQSFF